MAIKPNDNQIIIASKYVDLSSDAIKKSFQKTTSDTVNLSKEFDSLKRSISASMGNMKKSIVETMEKTSSSLKKTTDETKRHARTAGFELSKFEASFGSLRNKILVYLFAIRPLINTFKDLTESYSRQEEAVRRLGNAMGIQGVLNKEVSDSLIELSSSFQKTTRYGDEAVLEVMEKLVTLGRILPKDLEKVTQSVLDFSSSTGKDLDTSAKYFAAASEGITVGFRRVGIEIDKNIPKYKILEEVLKKVNEKMGGRAQADIETYIGRLTQMNNAWGEIKESLGKILIENYKLNKSFSYWNDFFIDLNIVLSKSTDKSAIFAEQLKEVNAEIKRLGAETTAKQQVGGLSFLFGGAKAEKEMILNAQNLMGQRKLLEDLIKKSLIEEGTKRMNVQKELETAALNQSRLKAESEFEEDYLKMTRSTAQYELIQLNERYAYYLQFITNKKELDEWYEYQRREIDLKILSENKKNMEEWKTFMQAYVTGVKDMFVNGLFKGIKEGFDDLGEVVVAFGDIMLKTLLEIVVKMAMVKMFAGFGQYLGVTSGVTQGMSYRANAGINTAASNAASSAVFGLGAHTGGYIYSNNNSYGYMKKYHSGGEVPAMLLSGEGVLNRNAMGNLGVDNLNKLNRGESAGGRQVINNYYIQTIDERSFRERLQQHGDIYSGSVEMGMSDNRSVRKSMQRWS